MTSRRPPAKRAKRARRRPAAPAAPTPDTAAAESASAAEEADGESEDEVVLSPDEVVASADVAADGDGEGAGEDEVVEPEVEEPEDEPRGRALTPFDPLQRYLTEIRRYPLLTREEEKELGIRYREHEDLEAAYRLVTGNLRLVVMIAREYQRATRNLLDLIQEGNIGLMEAVKKFDPYRGIRFPSYAVWWVRAYIIRYLINNWRVVKLGTTQAQRKLFFNLHKEKERLEREGIVPAPKLIAQRLDVKESEVIEMEQRLSSRDLSVDQPSNEESGATLLDMLPGTIQGPDQQVEDAEFRREIGEKIRAFGTTLKDKEAVIFSERLLAEQPLTLQEIGNKYGISRERVRQLEERLKRRLRAYLENEIKDLRDGQIDLD
ncbi:MAG TPA: RNA polymerase factor sigma-32 [Candidatus Dormibacteraeota bacterium]|nr:RNA polymerase factor sigma-32 [Candidatus Dormibacteraeota bacterium]